MNIFRKIFGRLSKKQRRLLQSADRGIFDPYLPIASIKPLGNQQQDWSMSEKSEAEPEGAGEDIRQVEQYWLLKTLVTVIGVIIVGRLTFLQISHGQENYVLAEGNRLKSEAIPPPRGLIYDRNGLALVKNVPSFSLVLELAELPKAGPARDEYLKTLSELLAVDYSQTKTSVEEAKTKKRSELVLLEGIDREKSLSYEIKLRNVSGVALVKTPVRLYSDLPSLGHLIGYIGKVSAEDKKANPSLLPTSFVGKAGLESKYEELLQGIAGIETLEVDHLGRAIRSVGNKPAQPGQSLFLTLDSALQRQAAGSLKDSIEKNHATSGAATVIDVRSGEVLAMVSFPTFDNNLFSPGTSSDERARVLQDASSPLINRAVAGQYPSGSTIKPVVAAAALEEKVITPSTRIDTSAGKISVGPWTFPDWKTHGVSDVRQAIAESNNIFFYTLGGGHGNIGGLGAERLASYMSRFGFGKKTGIDLLDETKGNVPTPDWKKKIKKESWYIGDTYNLSIGQGDLLVTPLQLTNATAAIANGGTLYQPRMLRSILSQAGQSTQSKAVVSSSEVVGAGNLGVVREGMRQTVLTGSARAFSSLGVEVAAKTGTAQFNAAKDRTHSWFTAFAPYQNPEIAVSVIVEGGGEGYSVAAPVAKNIIEQYFHLAISPIVPAVEEQ